MCEVKIWPWEDRVNAPIGMRISVGKQTMLGRGLRAAYKEWLWRGIKRGDPMIMQQLNYLRSRLVECGRQGIPLVLLYDHQVVGEVVKGCLMWGGW